MRKTKGFISIIATMILSAVAILIAVGSASRARSQTKTLTEQEAQAQSRSLADSCGDMALKKLGENRNYRGGENITVGGLSCEIISVSSGGGSYLIRTKGISGTAQTIIQIDALSIDPMTIRSWKEMPM